MASLCAGRRDPKILGTISGSALQGNTLPGSTFEGQVLVPPGTHSGNGQVLVPQASAKTQVVIPADNSNGLVPESVETVSLGPKPTNEDPEAMYERSYESLLRPPIRPGRVWLPHLSRQASRPQPCRAMRNTG